MSVCFKSRLNPWYIWIPSNPNLYSTKIIMKMRWQTIASNVSIRTISPTATPLPKAYDCVAVYIAGRRTSLVVYGWWPQPPTKKNNNCRIHHLWIRQSVLNVDNVIVIAALLYNNLAMTSPYWCPPSRLCLYDQIVSLDTMLSFHWLIYATSEWPVGHMGCWRVAHSLL